MANYFDLQNGPVLTTPSALTSPKITSIGYPGDDTAADTAGGQTITITGAGFESGATVLINTTAVGVVTVVSSTTITFTSPANSAGSYVLYVVNTDGGTAIAVPGIQYSGVPTWTTAAGSLGSYTETVAIANTVTATGDAPITYSVFSGSLPTGATLNSANGYISGTSPLTASPTTYTFTIRATDGQQQDTNRSFSLTINPDVVTWSSPANGTTYTSFANSAISNVALSASAASGQGIVYTANALPTGLSISGSNITGTPTVVANSSSLLTATAATTNATATRTINWVITVASDTYFNYVTTLLSANNPASTFVTDASTNNFAVSVFGDTRPNSFGPYTPGYYSNFFDGTGDYLNLASNSAFDMGSGDFTIEGWIYVTGSTSSRYLFGVGTVDGSTRSVAVWLGGTNNVEVYYSSTGNTWTSYIIGTTTIVTNTWYHIAFVKSGTTLTLYLNGVSQGSQSGTATGSAYSGQTVYVGGQTTSYPFNGYISNVRMVKGTAVYTSAFTPSTTPLTAIANTSLLTCQSNRFIDNSTNNFTITRNGDTLISGFDPFAPLSAYSTYGSGYFDGSGDYVLTQSTTAMNLGANPFCLEMWVYLNATGSTYYGICGSQTDYKGPSICRYNSNLMYGLSSNGSSWNVLSAEGSVGSITINPYTWYHVVLCRTGNTISAYVNGARDLTITSSATLVSRTEGFCIGNWYAGVYPWNGYISNARFVVGSNPYDATQTTITVPTTPLTAVANTQLLTLQNNQPNNNSMFLDSSTNNFNITRNGNTTQGSFSPYGGGWSNYFGTAQFKLSTTGMTALGSDFTLELWIYPTSFNDYNTIFDNRTSDGDASGLVLGLTSAAKVYFYTNAAFQITTATSISLNTWTHIALVRSGAGSGNVKIYINGVADANTATYTTSFTRTAPSIGDDWGTRSNLQYYGYLSNLRATTSALYTGSFTPSTTPLTAISGTVLLTCQSNRFIDNSFSALTMTVTGTPTIQRFNPFNPVTTTPTSYSGFFDGNGDYLTTPSNAALAFGSTDFCLEFWIYTTAFGSTDSRPLGNNNSWAANAWSLHSDHATANEKYTFWVYNYNSSSPMFTSTSSAALNTWTHVAITRSGNSWRMFINGTQEGSTVTSSAAMDGGSSDDMYIGGSGSANEYVTGYMSNVRAVKGSAVYTSNFTPSTTPLTAIANTSLLTLQSATFTDNSTNNFTLTANGNTAPRQFNPFGMTNTTGSSAVYTPALYGGSGYFDGTTDYLTAATGNLGSGDFTVEYWVYYTSLYNYISNLSTTRGSTGWSCGTQAVGQIVWYSSTAEKVRGTTSMKLNSWNHVAFVRSGGTLKGYLNGVQDGTTSTETTNFTNTSFAIGRLQDATPGEYLTGYMSDIRITVGQARYTSNFVPPVAPLTALQNTVLLNNMTGAGIYDSSMMNDFETVGNTSINTSIKKYGNTSVYFDGTGDYLIAPASQNFVFGTGDFTIECWLYLTATGADDGVIIELRSSGATSNGFVFNTHVSGGGYVLNFYTDSGSNFGSTVLSLNTWNHVAVTRSGSTVRLFSNGAVSATITKSNNFSNSPNPTIGQSLLYGNSNITGYIDDLRITKGVARYTTTFTPPTTPFITN